MVTLFPTLEVTSTSTPTLLVFADCNKVISLYVPVDNPGERYFDPKSGS